MGRMRNEASLNLFGVSSLRVCQVCLVFLMDPFFRFSIVFLLILSAIYQMPFLVQFLDFRCRKGNMRTGFVDLQALRICRPQNSLNALLHSQVNPRDRLVNVQPHADF